MIRWMFTHIYVSRSAHEAVNNLTGYSPGRASPEARGTPARAVAVWLSSGMPCLLAVCRRPYPDGDGGLPVLLTLQRVPSRTRVSHREPWRTCRRRRPALRGRADDQRDALAHAIPGRPTQSGPACLWLVPHPLELCPTRGDTPGPTRHRGVGGHRAPLAPRDGLGVETGQAGGQR